MLIEVLQGLPGSGKSTYVSAAMEAEWVAVVSADLFFCRNGQYQFDSTRLGDAHAWCFKEFLSYCMCRSDDDGRSITKLIVDNTNCRPHEAAPYMMAAAAFCHKARIVTFPCSVDDSVARNTHGVSRDVIERMYRDLTESEWPSYWRRDTFTL